MTRLSVNINKIATLRNARGGNVPNVLHAALKCEEYGANGITVHPRPDERHIRYQDVLDMKPMIKTEFNIEGYPSQDWMDLVIKIKPAQATLVPDPPDALTSNAGWDTVKHSDFLKECLSTLKKEGIRSSVFIGTDQKMIENAAACGADRVELYTEPYAAEFPIDKPNAVAPFISAAQIAHKCGLGINAGHDLNLENLAFFHKNIPHLDEVSIGHALISDALYFGLENTVQMYLSKLS